MKKKWSNIAFFVNSHMVLSISKFWYKFSGIFDPFQPFFLAEPLLCGDMIVAKIITNTLKNMLYIRKTRKNTLNFTQHGLFARKHFVCCAFCSEFSSFYFSHPSIWRKNCKIFVSLFFLSYVLFKCLILYRIRSILMRNKIRYKFSESTKWNKILYNLKKNKITYLFTFVLLQCILANNTKKNVPPEYYINNILYTNH